MQKARKIGPYTYSRRRPASLSQPENKPREIPCRTFPAVLTFLYAVRSRARVCIYKSSRDAPKRVMRAREREESQGHVNVSLQRPFGFMVRTSLSLSLSIMQSGLPYVYCRHTHVSIYICAGVYNTYIYVREAESPVY